MSKRENLRICIQTDSTRLRPFTHSYAISSQRAKGKTDLGSDEYIESLIKRSLFHFQSIVFDINKMQ